MRAPHTRILATYVLRSLRLNRTRTVVTIAGIALATCLLTAVFTSVTSIMRGLLSQVQADDGVWQVKLVGTTEEELARLRDETGEKLDRLSVERDLGAAALSDTDAESLGTYLNLATIPEEQDGCAHAAGDDEYEVITSADLTSGRLPEAAGEIVLPSTLEGVTLTGGWSSSLNMQGGVSSDGELALGSTITITAGRRHGIDVDGSSLTLTGDNILWYLDSSALTIETDALGNVTDVSSGGTVFAETLDDVDEARTYTVVGFYDTYTYDNGPVCLVSADEPDLACGSVMSAYFSTTGYSSYEDFEKLVDLVRDWDALDSYQASVGYHSRLLAYQGLGFREGYSDAFMVIAVVLAVVIALSAVVLISNAFNISLGERTRQYGLLASLGASRRQLGGSVFVEAAILGLVGIPIGVALGLVGTAAVFLATGEGWAAMMGTKESIAFAIKPWGIAISVALAVITVLASALYPALRAGRVPAVDAIRQTQDVHPSSLLRRTLARRKDADEDLAPDGRHFRGIAGRLGGVPGFLANRTRLCRGGKGHVTVASLALSVLLLVTAGVVSDYSTAILEAESEGSGPADAEIFISQTETGGADLFESADALLDDLEELDSTDGVSYAGIVYDQVVRFDTSDLDEQETTSAGSWDEDGYQVTRLYLVDNATWKSLAAEASEEDSFSDPSELNAIVYNTAQVYSDTTGASTDSFHPVLSKELTLDLLVLGGIGDGCWIDSYGSDGISIVSWDDESSETVVEMSIEDATVNELSTHAVTMDELPSWFCIPSDDLKNSFPTIIMPMSAALEQGLVGDGVGYTASNKFMEVYLTATDPASALEDALDVVSSTAGMSADSYENATESSRQSLLMARAVETFLYCFMAIMSCIAIANVFNTISSGIMLRTREFAVLRSVGMGERAFVKMIVLEIASYTVRGFVWGLLLSLVIGGSIYVMSDLSSLGIGILIPWAHVAAALVVVTAVIVASTLYALWRTNAFNLAEALRTDLL